MSLKPKVYLAWFCPFAQRAWIALLHKGVSFEYIEQDPYNKTEDWLAISRQGLVPAILHNGKSICQSNVCLQYIDDAWPEGPPLCSVDPYEKAFVRMWVDHIEKQIVPNYYTMLMKTNESHQTKSKSDILKGILEFTAVMHSTGPYFLGDTFGYADIMLAPFAQRIELILRHYRDFDVPRTPEFGRYREWWTAVRQVDCVRLTFQPENQLVAKYKRYTDNTARTLVADAIRDGTHLP